MEACGSYRYQDVVSKKLELNLLNTVDQQVPSAVVIVLLHSQHQKVKRKFQKLS